MQDPRKVLYVDTVNLKARIKTSGGKRGTQLSYLQGICNFEAMCFGMRNHLSCTARTMHICL